MTKETRAKNTTESKEQLYGILCREEELQRILKLVLGSSSVLIKILSHTLLISISKMTSASKGRLACLVRHVVSKYHATRS
jgi:hypothetical protein